VKVVHKFTVIEDGNAIAMDPAAQIVHFAVQNGMCRLWALLNPTAPAIHRQFRVFGTGHPIPEEYQHRGTCLDGMFVWHLFERVDQPGSGTENR
jgi:hypothetical protein